MSQTNTAAPSAMTEHSLSAAQQASASRGLLRHDWAKDEIKALFELPFNDLIFKAHTVHRQNFDPNAVQVSTLDPDAAIRGPLDGGEPLYPPATIARLPMCRAWMAVFCNVKTVDCTCVASRESGMLWGIAILPA